MITWVYLGLFWKTKVALHLYKGDNPGGQEQKEKKNRARTGHLMEGHRVNCGHDVGKEMELELCFVMFSFYFAYFSRERLPAGGGWDNKGFVAKE